MDATIEKVRVSRGGKSGGKSVEASPRQALALMVLRDWTEAHYHEVEAARALYCERAVRL